MRDATIILGISPPWRRKPAAAGYARAGEGANPKF
jgi:hypothetical protein